MGVLTFVHWGLRNNLRLRWGFIWSLILEHQGWSSEYRWGLRRLHTCVSNCLSRWTASGHWLTASVFSLVFDFRWMDLWCDCCFFRSSGIVFSSWVSAIADGYQRMLIAEWWTSTISWNFTKYIKKSYSNHWKRLLDQQSPPIWLWLSNIRKLLEGQIWT